MFTKTLIATCFAALAAAQSSVLTFTYVPNPITDGQAEAITYTTNDTTTPVTITLLKGASDNLQKVEVLTTDATGGQFVWTPSFALADGTDYALEITQGSQVNYFGTFEIQGANPTSVAAASSSLATASSSVAAANGTTLAPVTTVGTVGTVESAGAATGTALPRNTTMSIATLTSATVTSAGSTAGSTGAGFQGTSTASASSSTSSNDTPTLKMGSAWSLFLGAAAAALYI